MSWRTLAELWIARSFLREQETQTQLLEHLAEIEHARWAAEDPEQYAAYQESIARRRRATTKLLLILLSLTALGFLVLSSL